MIGGFVVIFSVIISILSNSNILDYTSKLFTPILNMLGLNTNFAKPILSGIIELTNGINMVTSVSIKEISQNVILCAFLLGFGGLSVLFQVGGLLSKTDLSMKKYVFGKFLQGILAAIYTFLALKLIPTLSLDITPTFVPALDTVIYPIHFFGVSNYLILLLTIIFIVCIAFSHKEHKPYGKKQYK